MRVTLPVVCATVAALAAACPPASHRPASAALTRALRPLPVLLPQRRQFLVRAPQQQEYDDRHHNDLVYEFNVFADDYGVG
ncbi:hypothetical protein RR48_02877 [Papilio machaon]|uniref:Uncharacterized protein n=1 Tax=Papilio machaon TaxID=76193 RepID=A0A0N0PAZ8_PAPMA|nr:hypothetical protein RR48_02877 [Papilio machaon]